MGIPVEPEVAAQKPPCSSALDETNRSGSSRMSSLEILGIRCEEDAPHALAAAATACFKMLRLRSIPHASILSSDQDGASFMRRRYPRILNGKK